LLPPILAGRDVLGQAKTGTGKTAAFSLPMLNNLDKDLPFQAIILGARRASWRSRSRRRCDRAGAAHADPRDDGVRAGQAVKTQAGKLERGSHIIRRARPGG